MESVMIIGHPGHELRAYRWMEQAQPVVHVLTDGSGSLSEGRIDSTAKTVESAEAKNGRYFGGLKDGIFYQDLLETDPSHFVEALFEIYQSITEAGPRELLIAGDSIEGYNTAHDMTRYMINILCGRLRAEGYVIQITPSTWWTTPVRAPVKPRRTTSSCVSVRTISNVKSAQREITLN